MIGNSPSAESLKQGIELPRVRWNFDRQSDVLRGLFPFKGDWCQFYYFDRQVNSLWCLRIHWRRICERDTQPQGFSRLRRY
jgi:hypothetical protein